MPESTEWNRLKSLSDLRVIGPAGLARTPPRPQSHVGESSDTFRTRTNYHCTVATHKSHALTIKNEVELCKNKNKNKKENYKDLESIARLCKDQWLTVLTSELSLLLSGRIFMASCRGRSCRSAGTPIFLFLWFLYFIMGTN